MISLLNNIKSGLRRAEQFKIFLNLFFLSICYFTIPDTNIYVYNALFYTLLPELLKYINGIIIRKDNTILSFKSISGQYVYKIIDFSCYWGIIKNYNSINLYLPNNTNFNFIAYLSRSFIEMHRYRYYCEVIIGTLIVMLCVIFYPFLNLYYKRCEIIISNLTSISITTYRNVLNSIIDGQSIYLNIDNITIISIPPKYKEHITEEALENIAPKKMPIKRSLIKRDNIIEHHNCAICLDVIKITKEMSRILPKCNHIFHCSCIDNWFFSGHSSCPICREQVV